MKNVDTISDHKRGEERGLKDMCRKEKGCVGSAYYKVVVDVFIVCNAEGQ